MIHHLESQLGSLLSLILHILRVVIKKYIISFKRRTEPAITPHKRLKDVALVQQKINTQDTVTNGSHSKVEEADKGAKRMRKRPAMILVPESCLGSAFAGNEKKGLEEKNFEVEGNGYCLVSRRGKSRHVMEDGHGVITNINGDSKQAYFGVFDGHGGRAAVDFVSEKLGINIVAETVDQGIDEAIKMGYLTTDREFLSKGVSSGVCVATVLLKNGELHASNVGDCRVVLSRNGVATALTRDHSAGSEDERNRIERSGGYVTCHNGVWRVNDTLAVSRAIGDANMKKWVIPEPETMRVRLTPDCEFLVMASDGLWGKVSNQEAVDVVSRYENSLIESCKALVEMSVMRGGRDDITVMVVDLKNFV